MEPRWIKVSSAVVEGLEASIATEELKVILVQAAVDRMNEKDAFPVKEDKEGDIEFVRRLEQFEMQKRSAARELKERVIRLDQLILAYKKFLAGESILGELTGPLTRLEAFGAAQEEPPKQ